MSFFTNRMGLDPSAVRTTLGVDQGGGFGDNKTDDFFVEYVELDRDIMEQVEDYYDNLEPLVDAANRMMSYHNLGGRFRVLFADTLELDDDKYHHKQSVELLLEQARRHKHKFGFIMVQDANAHLDQMTREILEEPLRDDDDANAEAMSQLAAAAQDMFGARRATNGNEEQLDNAQLEERQKQVEQASMHMHRAAEALGEQDERERLLGTARETTDEGQFGRGARTEVQQLQSGAEPGRGVRESVVVRYENRTSTLEAPSATATIVSEAGRNRNERPAPRVARRTARTFEEVFASLRDLRTVSWRDGRVFLEINRMTNERRVVFCRSSQQVDGTDDDQIDQYGTASRNRLPRSVRIDHTVKVFVWPNRMPDDQGRINTRITELIYLRAQMTAADRRLTEADESNVKPTVFLRYDEKMTPESYRDMTEQERFTGTGDMSGSRRRDERQQSIREYQLAVAADVLNGKRRDELARAIASGVAKRTVEGADGQRHYADKGGERIFTLPRGYAVSNVVSGKTIDDIVARRTHYETRVSSVMGIPLSLLDGGAAGTTGKSGGSSGNVTSSAAALASDSFRSTILKDREDLSIFFSGIYEAHFRDKDNTAFARLIGNTRVQRKRANRDYNELLENLRERYRMISDAAERVRTERAIEENEAYVAALSAHYESIENEVRRVVSLESRLKIEFDKQLFVTFDELDLARSTFAISGFEYANIVRTKMAMEPITKSEYERNRKEQLEQMKDETKASAPPQQPGANSQPKSSNGQSNGSSSSTASSDKKRKQSSSSTSSSSSGRKSGNGGNDSLVQALETATKRARSLASEKSSSNK